MGFTFRKRNPKGLNVSLSSKGLRISKTAKFGSTTVNYGHTIGGKTTRRITTNFGNGVQYRKDKTISKRYNPNHKFSLFNYWLGNIFWLLLIFFIMIPVIF